MIEHDKLIAAIIAAAGGKIVGRIRLQKIIYLLDQKGLKAEAGFHYHHYGPYSRLIDIALERAKVLRGVQEDVDYRKSDGAAFIIFTTGEKTAPKNIGSLRQAEAVSLLNKLSVHTATVLELAATIHWLAFSERYEDWRSELVRRKGAKTKDGRSESALDLLKELDLAPA